jgi:hypothetical protein
MLAVLVSADVGRAGGAQIGEAGVFFCELAIVFQGLCCDCCYMSGKRKRIAAIALCGEGSTPSAQ